MLHNKFVLLLITFIWMSGLFAVVLSLTHIQMDRRKHRYDENYTWNVPRILWPLYASLATFCLGLAIHAFVAQQPISLLIACVWGILAFVFTVRTIALLSTGNQQGWNFALDTQPIHSDSENESPQRSWFPIWSGTVLVLLLVNLFVLAWWGSSLLIAGGREQTLSANARGAGVTALAVVESLPEPSAGQAAATEAPVSAAVAITMPLSATIEPTSGPLPVLPAAQIEDSIVLTESVAESQAPTESVTATVEPLAPSVTVRSVDGANVREAPKLTAEIITVLEDSSEARVLGRTTDNQWFFIALADGSSGWISILVAEPNETIENAPIMMPE